MADLKQLYIIGFNALIFFILLIQEAHGSFYYCDMIDRLNCRTRAEAKKCGSDGVTYYNMCELSVEKCKNKNLIVVHDGECRPPTSDPITNDGVRPFYDIFCLDLVNHPCSRERQSPLCGSDNNVYRSLCEFDKARCTNRHLHIVKYGPC